MKRGCTATGSKIEIDPRETVKTATSSGVTTSPYAITLGHELGHLYSKHNGIYNFETWATLQGNRIKLEEISLLILRIYLGKD